MSYKEIVNVEFKDTNSKKVSDKLNAELNKIRANAKNLGLDEALDKLKSKSKLINIDLLLNIKPAEKGITDFINKYKNKDIVIKLVTKASNDVAKIGKPDTIDNSSDDKITDEKIKNAKKVNAIQNSLAKQLFSMNQGYANKTSKLEEDSARELFAIHKRINTTKIQDLKKLDSLNTRLAKNSLNYIKKTEDVRKRELIDINNIFNKFEKEKENKTKQLFSLNQKVSKFQEDSIKKRNKLELQLAKQIAKNVATNYKKQEALNTKLYKSSMSFIEKTKNARKKELKELFSLNQRLSKFKEDSIKKTTALEERSARELYAIHKRINADRRKEARKREQELKKFNALNAKLAKSQEKANLKNAPSLQLLESKQVLDTLTNLGFNRVFFNSTLGAKKLRKELIAIQQGVKFDGLNADFIKMNKYIQADVNASKDLKRALADIESRLPALRQKFIKHNSIVRTLGASVNKTRSFFVGLTRAFIGVMVVKSVTETIGKMYDLQSAMNSLKLHPNFGKIEEQFNKTAKATNGLVSKMQIVGAVNKALYMNVDLTNGKLTKLTQMVSKVAVGMGQDTGTLLNDFITALAKGSPIILDNVGVLLKMEEAQRLTYDSLTNTTLSYKEWSKTLTQADKRANFTTQGIKKLGEITKDLEMPMNNFKASFNKVKDEFIDLIPILQSFVSILGRLHVFEALSFVVLGFIKALGGVINTIYRVGRALDWTRDFAPFLSATEATDQFNKALDNLPRTMQGVIKDMDKLNDSVRNYLKLINVAKEFKSAIGVLDFDIKENAIKLTAKNYIKVLENLRKSKEIQKNLIESVTIYGKLSGLTAKKDQTYIKQSAKLRANLDKINILDIKKQSLVTKDEEKALNDLKLNLAKYYNKKETKIFLKRIAEKKEAIKRLSKSSINTAEYKNEITLLQRHIKKKEKEYIKDNAVEYTLFQSNKKRLKDEEDRLFTERLELREKFRKKNRSLQKADIGIIKENNYEKDYSTFLKSAPFWRKNLTKVLSSLNIVSDVDEMGYQGVQAIGRLKQNIYDELTKAGVKFDKIKLFKNVDKLISEMGLKMVTGKRLPFLDLLFKRMNIQLPKTNKHIAKLKDNWVELTRATQKELLSPFDKKYRDGIDKISDKMLAFKKMFDSFKGRNKAFIDINFDAGTLDKLKNGSKVAVEDVIQQFDSIGEAVESTLDDTTRHITRFQKIDIKSFKANTNALTTLLKNFMADMQLAVEKYKIKLKFDLDQRFITSFIQDASNLIKTIKIPEIKLLNLKGFDRQLKDLEQQTRIANDRLLTLELAKNNKLKLIAEREKARVRNDLTLDKEAKLKALEKNLPTGKDGGTDYKALIKAKRDITEASEEELKEKLKTIDIDLKIALIKNSDETTRKRIENGGKRVEAVKEHSNLIYEINRQNIDRIQNDENRKWTSTLTFIKRVGNSFRTIKVKPIIDINSFFAPAKAIERAKRTMETFHISPEFKKFIEYNKDAGKYGKFSIKVNGINNLGSDKLKELQAMIQKINEDFGKLAKASVRPAELMKEAFKDSLRDIGQALSTFGADMTFKLADNNNMLALKRKEDLANIKKDEEDGNITKENALIRQRDIEKKFLLDKENYEKQARKQLLMGLAQTFWAKGSGYLIESVASLAEHKYAQASGEAIAGTGLIALGSSLGYLGSQIQMATMQNSKATGSSETKDNYYDVHYALYNDKTDFNRKLVKYNGGR